MQAKDLGSYGGGMTGYVTFIIRIIIVGLTEETTTDGREAVMQMYVEKPRGRSMQFLSDYS